MDKLISPILRFRISTLFLLTAYQYLPAQSPVVELKFGQGLQITAADSSMALKIGFRFQSLYSTERVWAKEGEGKSHFLIRRSRLKLDGWALSPNLIYKVEMALSNRDLNSSTDFEETSEAPKIILDAVIKYKFHKNLALWVGQTKLPGNRERVVSSQKLQFVDRSLVNSIFNIDREMGVQLRGKFRVGNFLFKPIGSLSLGEGRNITNSNIGGSHIVGRMEFLPFGEFTDGGDYFQSDLRREPKPKLGVGASYAYNKGGARQKATGRFLVNADGSYFKHNLEVFFADLIFKYRGLSVIAEFADKKVAKLPLRSVDINLRQSLIDIDGKSYYTGQGIMTSISYLFKNNWEIAGRYTQVVPNAKASFSRSLEYTFGLSKYVAGHHLKVQSDVSMIDIEGESGKKFRLRLQTEIAF